MNGMTAAARRGTARALSWRRGFAGMLWVVLLWTAGAHADGVRTFVVSTVPNPRVQHGGWVSDPSHALSRDVSHQIETSLRSLNADLGAEVTLVILPSIGRAEPRAFANELFNTWKVGRAGVDDGVLILHVLDQRRLEIETGYGVEHVLPDATCSRILRDDTIPLLKKGDFDQAHGVMVDRVTQTLRARSPANGVTSGDAMHSPMWLTVLFWLGLLAAIGVGVQCLRMWRRFERTLRERPRLAFNMLDDAGSKAWVVATSLIGWYLPTPLAVWGLDHHRMAATVGLGGSFFALTRLQHAAVRHTPDPSRRRRPERVAMGALTVALLAGWLFAFGRRGEDYGLTFLRAACAYAVMALAWAQLLRLRTRARSTPRACHACGQAMQRQNEAAEDAFLVRHELIEEDLGSRDYDAWKCDQGHLRIEGYDGHLPLSRCVACDRPAYKKVGSTVVEEPTYMSSGLARDTYRCFVCDFKVAVDRVVPRRSSSSSSSGFGGGGGGSSFGGGSSGGGGAGGSY